MPCTTTGSGGGGDHHGRVGWRRPQPQHWHLPATARRSPGTTRVPHAGARAPWLRPAESVSSFSDPRCKRFLHFQDGFVMFLTIVVPPEIRIHQEFTAQSVKSGPRGLTWITWIMDNHYPLMDDHYPLRYPRLSADLTCCYPRYPLSIIHAWISIIHVLVTHGGH